MMNNILFNILAIQIIFIILKGTRLKNLIYLFLRFLKQLMILNYNILIFLFKQTKDINKKLENCNKQNKKKEIKHKKVVNGDNVIDFKKHKNKEIYRRKN